MKLIGALAALLLFSMTAVCQDNSSQSIYQLSSPLTDQAGNDTTIATYQGSPVVISMFYGSCPHVCPMLISTIQRMEQQLPAESRDKLRVLMVSLDSEKDTPEALAEVARQRHVDTSRWKLVNASEAEVRKIAAVLGIRYRRLPDGQFNHSTVLTLLDADGVIVAKTSTMTSVDPEFLLEIKDRVQ